MSTVRAQLRAARSLPPLPESFAPELREEMGLRLKEMRERRQISVSQVSDRLKIRGQYIKALEEGKFSHIPGQIYVDGYIRNYADYLGLSSEQFVASFRSSKGGRGSNDDNFMLPEITHDEMKPGRPVLLIALLFLFVVFAVWSILNREKEVLPAEGALSGAAISPKALDARIVILAKKDVSITLTAQEGVFTLEKLLHGGETFFVPAEAQFVKTDMPDALQFFVDGQSIAPQGAQVITETGILLNPEKLLKSAGYKTGNAAGE